MEREFRRIAKFSREIGDVGIVLGSFYLSAAAVVAVLDGNFEFFKQFFVPGLSLTGGGGLSKFFGEQTRRVLLDSVDPSTPVPEAFIKAFEN